MHIPLWNYSSDVAYIKISYLKSKYKHHGNVIFFYYRLPFYNIIYCYIFIKFWIHPLDILLGESRYGVFIFVFFNLKYFELFREYSRKKISLNIFIFIWISLFSILRLLIRRKIKIVRNYDSDTKNNFSVIFQADPLTSAVFCCF